MMFILIYIYFRTYSSQFKIRAVQGKIFVIYKFLFYFIFFWFNLNLLLPFHLHEIIKIIQFFFFK